VTCAIAILVEIEKVWIEFKVEIKVSGGVRAIRRAFKVKGAA
jgi:hypothetical protein